MAELYSNLGLAPIGERDILMADFGPTNRFNQGPNADGIVWWISPEGEMRRLVDGGIGAPGSGRGPVSLIRWQSDGAEAAAPRYS